MIKLSCPNLSEKAIEAVGQVLRSGNLVQGKQCALFEEELAGYLGIKHVALVSSGTAALHVSLMALDIGYGDAVIVPDFTFPATANAVAMTGATPLMVDVEIDTYNISTKAVNELIATWSGPQKLKAIIPVHEFGLPANIDEIMAVAEKHNLYVIEDAACALGATYHNKKAGTFGDLGCFSFHPRKTITTGEGGAIATNDDKLDQRVRALRNHGMLKTSEGMQFVEASTNYRMTDFQAALGRSQLPELNSWLLHRRRLVSEYADQLTGLISMGIVNLPIISNEHSYQTFMILLSNEIDRNQLIQKLKDEGVETNLGAQCLSELNLYAQASIVKGNANKLSNSGLALPLHEKITTEEVAYVCGKLKKIIEDLL